MDWSKTGFLRYLPENRKPYLSAGLTNQWEFSHRNQLNPKFARFCYPLLRRLFQKNDKLKFEINNKREKAINTHLKFPMGVGKLDDEARECQELAEAISKWLMSWQAENGVDEFTFKALDLENEEIVIYGLKALSDSDIKETEEIIEKLQKSLKRQKAQS